MKKYGCRDADARQAGNGGTLGGSTLVYVLPCPSLRVLHCRSNPRRPSQSFVKVMSPGAVSRYGPAPCGSAPRPRNRSRRVMSATAWSLTFDSPRFARSRLAATISIRSSTLRSGGRFR